MGLYQWGDASKSLSKRSQLFNHEVGRLPSTPESRSKAGQACGMELVTIAARSFAISSPNSIKAKMGWMGRFTVFGLPPTPQKKTRLTTFGSPTGAAANAATVPVFQLHQETIVYSS